MQNMEKFAKKMHFGFLVIFNSSHAVLSIIFGFLGKFRVGEVKIFWKKIFFRDEKHFGRRSKKYFSRPKKIENFSYEKVNDKWKFQIFEEKMKFPFFIDFFIGFLSKCFWSRKIFSGFFRKIFHLEKICFFKIFFTTPTQNFPKNPKIILRNSCDELKDTKNIKCDFFASFPGFWLTVTYTDP